MTARARKPCGEPGCPNLAPCAQHTAKAWQPSSGQTTRIRGRRSQRRAWFVIARDDGVCWICGQPGADQADHVIPLAEGGADHHSNMRAAHAACNASKAQHEAARGRARARKDDAR